MKLCNKEITITGEEIFAASTEHMVISPSESGYTLAYSEDGVKFSLYEEDTPADEVLVLRCVPVGTILKLSGNTSEVKVLLI